MQAKQAAGPYIYTDETIQNQESARIQSYHKNSLAEIKTSQQSDLNQSSSAANMKTKTNTEIFQHMLKKTIKIQAELVKEIENRKKDP